MAENAVKSVRLGVIGGSGVYQMEGVDVVAEHDLDTPFGTPSDKVVETRIKGRTVMFLPRHGRGHRARVLGRDADEEVRVGFAVLLLLPKLVTSTPMPLPSCALPSAPCDPPQ
mgnify:CR=1 FL=1